MAIHHIDTTDWTPEQWTMYRYKGIGASEMGTLLGINEFQCSLQLFHLKIGRYPSKRRNRRMNIGVLSESVIADMWEYFDHDDDKFNLNMEMGRKVRSCQNVNSFIHNDDFPYLFVSLDRVFSDPRFKTLCSLELKNKTYASYHKYSNGINPSEVIQLSMQLLIPKHEYGEIAYLIDNMDMKVLPLTYDYAKKSKNAIVNVSGKFWENVLQARKYINQIENAKLNFNQRLVEELEMEILKLEPEPERNEVYLEYLTDLEREKRETVPIKADEALIKKANDMRRNQLKRAKLDEAITEAKAYMAELMHKEQKFEIDFGKLGKVKMYNGRFITKLK